MNLPEYERIHAYERDYWWHAARRWLVRRTLERFARFSPEDDRYLDLGCGTGIQLDEFAPQMKRVFALDYSSTALRLTRTRIEVPMVQADARHLPYQSNSFGLITCLDIIEHIREDMDALGEAYRVCKPGGWLILSVPALDFLWSEHDEAVYHLRRYALPSLKAKARHAGFEVVHGTYATALMLFPVFAIRLVSSFTRKTVTPQGHDFPIPPAWINRLLIRIHAIETAISLRIPLPFGTGIVCLLRKPETVE